MPPPLDEIRAAVQARQAWGIRALQDIIAVDSLAPDEEPCQLALAERLQDAGLPVELLPLDDGTLRSTNGFIDSGLRLDRRPNLVTHIGRPDGGRSLVLNSHIDTVTWADTADRWDVHPLSGAVRDGRLYGRGAMDAKGQVMSAIVAVLALHDLGYEPLGRAIVHSAVSEEPDGNGTLALCSQGWVGDAAINLEATDNHVAYGHRGIIGLRYHFEQAARHASIRGGQENVIVKAGRLADALDRGLTGWSDPSDALYGPPTLNVGRIEGGDDIFTTPHRVTMDVGVRYAPGTYDQVMSALDDSLTRDLTPRPTETQPLDSAIFQHFDAASVPPDGELAQTFLGCANTIDDDRRLVVFPAGCDARHFVNRYRTPTLIFGPGRLEQAHGINEYLDLAQWQKASEILALFITRWCR